MPAWTSPRPRSHCTSKANPITCPTAEGHRQRHNRLAAVSGARVIGEATGGYERAVVAALHAAPIPVSVINPARVRPFARAFGELAKTDPMDAARLTAFGRAFPPRTAAHRHRDQTGR